jgi:DNA-binding transcriptional regulator YiaG
LVLYEGKACLNVEFLNVFTIYGLIDPRHGCLRYIGRTKQVLHNRLISHLSAARCQQKWYCTRWIAQLLAEGHQPLIWALETTAEPHIRERFWIVHYRSAGCDLTNETNGGEGPLSPKMSPETRAKISAALRGRKKRPLTDAEKENLRRHSTGRIKSPETLEKLRQPRPNAGPAIRAAKLGKKRAPFSEEWRANISASHKDKPQSEKHRQANIAAHRAKRLERPGHNARLSPESVQEIRRLLGEKKLSQDAIAKRYGVCQLTIWRISKEETYRWVR